MLFIRFGTCYTGCSKGTEVDDVFFHRKKKEPGYDTEHCLPVIRQSICTGEKTAGFQNRETGKFIEVMLIRTQADLDAFRAQYGIEGEIKTIY